jgi:CheY-like chemotaxis protein
VNSGNYDIILMDVQMPEMDGYEATKIIRGMENSKATIPIMAMTANVLKAEVDRCFSAGMNAYISKPFDRKTLLQNIDKILVKSNC